MWAVRLARRPCVRDAQVRLADSGEAAHGGRHAVLHDFCMVIPYSAVIAAAGLVTLVFGSRTAGVQLLLGGAVMGAAAASSLSRWKKQLPSRLVTTFAAGVNPSSTLRQYPCTAHPVYGR